MKVKAFGGKFSARLKLTSSVQWAEIFSMLVSWCRHWSITASSDCKALLWMNPFSRPTISSAGIILVASCWHRRPTTLHLLITTHYSTTRCKIFPMNLMNKFDLYSTYKNDRAWNLIISWIILTGRSCFTSFIGFLQPRRLISTRWTLQMHQVCTSMRCNRLR